jgi:hypothetical protein
MPEKTFTIRAVASATPSINPTASALAPSVVTMKTGSRLWMISEDTSINRLTKPSIQMLVGSLRSALVRAVIAAVSVHC